MSFLSFLFGGGASVYGTAVTPGDVLYARMASDPNEITLTTRQLAQHWAVKSVTGQIARGLNSVDLDVVRQDRNGYTRVGNQAGADLLRPHVKRIAMDVLRYGWHVSIVAPDGNNSPFQLIPIPADEATGEFVDGKITGIKLGTKTWDIGEAFIVAEEMPPESPLECLRGIIEEDVAAGEWRRDAWKTAPRGIVTRGLDSPEWSNSARERFQTSFLRNLTGKRVAVVEDGMQWQETNLPDAGSAQFLEARKLTADIVCDIYGVQGSVLATGADRQVAVGRRQMLTGSVADLGKLISEAYTSQLAVQQYGAVNGERITVKFDIDVAVWREGEEPSLATAAVGTAWRTVNEVRRAEGREPIEGGDSLSPQESKTVVTKAVDTKSAEPIRVTRWVKLNDDSSIEEKKWAEVPTDEDSPDAYAIGHAMNFLEHFQTPERDGNS